MKFKNSANSPHDFLNSKIPFEKLKSGNIIVPVPYDYYDGFYSFSTFRTLFEPLIISHETHIYINLNRSYKYWRAVQKVVGYLKPFRFRPTTSWCLYKSVFKRNVCSFHQCHLNSVDPVHRYLHLKMGLPPILNAGSSGIMRT